MVSSGQWLRSFHVLQCCCRILQFLSKLSRTMLCLVKLAYIAF